MHPAITRFCASVGRRLLVWLAVVVVIRVVVRFHLLH